MPAVELLERAGLWERLAPQAAPLRVMRIADAGGAEGGDPRDARTSTRARSARRSSAGTCRTGCSRREMVARLAELPAAELRAGVRVERVTPRTDAALGGAVGRHPGARARWSSPPTAATARCARRSASARGAGATGRRRWSSPSTHALPHDGVSTEIHRSGGPFTLVPLPDRDGAHASAVVWMEAGPRAAALAALPAEAFEAALNAARLRRARRAPARRPAPALADRRPGRRPARRAAHGAGRRGGARGAADRRAGAEHEPRATSRRCSTSARGARRRAATSARRSCSRRYHRGPARRRAAAARRDRRAEPRGDGGRAAAARPAAGRAAGAARRRRRCGGRRCGSGSGRPSPGGREGIRRRDRPARAAIGKIRPASVRAWIAQLPGDRNLRVGLRRGAKRRCRQGDDLAGSCAGASAPRAQRSHRESQADASNTPTTGPRAALEDRQAGRTATSSRAQAVEPSPACFSRRRQRPTDFAASGAVARRNGPLRPGRGGGRRPSSSARSSTSPAR